MPEPEPPERCPPLRRGGVRDPDRDPDVAPDAEDASAADPSNAEADAPSTAGAVTARGERELRLVEVVNSSGFSSMSCSILWRMISCWAAVKRFDVTQ